MKQWIHRAAAICLSVSLGSSFASAAQVPAPVETSQPTTSATVESMQVVIVEVNGSVRVRTDSKAEWKKAEVDMIVGENAEFRTGPRSSVTCVIPPDQSFTLDRMSTMSVLEAIKEGKTVKTDLAMKYGRVRYNIEAAGVEHRAVIRSPSSTLAVRGTQVSLYDQPPFAPVAQSFTGRADFGNAKRTFSVGGKSYAKAVAGSSVATTALNESVVDPRLNWARSEADSRLIANEVSRGAVLSFDPIANIDVITGGSGPLSDSLFAANPPGAANFFLRWTGNADLNLTVTLQPGNATDILFSFDFQPTEILYPGYSLNTTKSGGRIAFDHRGGANGGTETAFYKSVIPGLYGISARNISGEAADLKFNVVVNGVAMDIFTEELTKGKQISRTIQPGQEIVGIVGVPPIDLALPDDTGVSASSVSTQSVRKSRTTTVAKQPKLTPVSPVTPRVVSGKNR